MVEMSPKVNMITIKKVNPRVALSVSDYASKYARTAHLSMTPYTLFVSNVLPEKARSTYISDNSCNTAGSLTQPLGNPTPESTNSVKTYLAEWIPDAA
jgi:hypothetical protein